MFASSGSKYPPNPRLCDLCQAWDELSAVIFEPNKAHRLLDISRNDHCLICRNVSLALSSRPNELDIESPGWQRSPQACVVVSGPYYFGPAYSSSTSASISPHFADRDEENQERVTNVLIQLRISFTDIENPETLVARLGLSGGVTPQFSMRYRLDEGRGMRLVDMQPWQSTFADVGIMRKWIRGCEQIHGAQCMAPVERSSSGM